MNLAICLDVSGSRAGGLGSVKNNKSRLLLSLEAIRMLISKPKPNDSVSLSTFDNQVQVIFEQMFKKEISYDIYERLDCIDATGRTAIIKGFKASSQLLKKQAKSQKDALVQNRIVILTDVDD